MLTRYSHFLIVCAVLVPALAAVGCRSASDDDDLSCPPGYGLTAEDVCLPLADDDDDVVAPDDDDDTGNPGDTSDLFDPQGNPPFNQNFGDSIYTFTWPAYVLYLYSNGSQVVVLVDFINNPELSALRLVADVDSATEFTIFEAYSDDNGNFEFEEEERSEASGTGSVTLQPKYEEDGLLYTYLLIENIVVGGQELGFIDGYLDGEVLLLPGATDGL